MEPNVFLVPHKTSVKKLQTEEGQRPRYRVQLIRSGTVERRFGVLVIPADAVKNALDKFNNVSGYTHQLGQHVPTYLYSEQDKVGFYNKLKLSKVDGSEQMIEADFIAAKTQKGMDIAEHLDMAIEEENDLYQQLSAVFSAKTTYVVDTDSDGKETLKEIVQSIESVRSVDFVDIGAFPLKATKKLGDEGFSVAEGEKGICFNSNIMSVSLSFDHEVDLELLKAERQKLDNERVKIDAWTNKPFDELKGVNLNDLEEPIRGIVETRIKTLESVHKLAEVESERASIARKSLIYAS